MISHMMFVPFNFSQEPFGAIHMRYYEMPVGWIHSPVGYSPIRAKNPRNGMKEEFEGVYARTGVCVVEMLD